MHAEVEKELKAWNLEDISEVFAKEGVTKPIMWDFTCEELKELGVRIVTCKKYLRAAEQIKREGFKQVI